MSNSYTVSQFCNKPLKELEKEIILARLKLYHDDKSKAARSLGVSVKTLYNKLERYGHKNLAG